MDNYELWYFIEGTNTGYTVIIPKDKQVIQLKEEIQKQWCHTHCKGVDAGELDLLKINMPLSPDETDFHKLQAPDDAEKMHWQQQIEQLWPDKPARYYLHVCVRLPDRAVSVESRQLPFQHLHHVLWGQKFHVLKSPPFGDEGELEYLAAEEINRLKLLDLEYGEDVLLFRREYITAYESLGSPTNTKRGVVIIGQPGIGKSIFLYYVLLRRLSDRLPTAFQLSNSFVLFQASGAQSYPNDEYDLFIPPGTLALADVRENVSIPCNAFLHASWEGNARIVQAAPPYQDSWKEWRKQHGANLYVMNYFSADEIKVLGTILHLKVDDLLRIYNTWGPDARNCVWFAQDPEAEGHHRSQVGFAVEAFIRNFPSSMRDLDALQVPHVLFSVLPEETRRHIPMAQVASNHINNLILNATTKAETAEQIAFFKSLRTDIWFKSPADRILKAYVLAWLSAHPASTPIPCTAAAAEAPTLEIPVCPKDRAIPFTGVTLLRDINKHPLPFCFLSVSQTFPTVDAIVFGKKLLITVQVTASSRHSANSSAFKQIWDHLPLAIRQKYKWCHVFVTGDEGTAATLRRQQRENPPGIVIFYYSAVFEVGQLGLIRKHLNEVGPSIIESIIHHEDNEEEDDPSETDST